MNKSKQLQKGVVALSLVLMASTWGHAAFTSLSKTTKTASASLTGTGAITFDITVKQVSNNAVAQDIAWSGVTLPATWKNADHYIEMNHTVTSSNGGIRIVTENKSAGASPLYIGASTAAAAGLIDNTDPTKSLSVGWTIKDAVVGSTGPVSAKPYEPADGAGQNDQFQWLFITDSADTSIAQDDPYRIAVNGSGIHFDGKATGFGGAPSPNFVYFEANFTTAVTPRTYSTSKLTVESFTQ